MRTPLLAGAAALLLGLAACDSRDYEAEIAELNSQLEQAQSELQQAMSENEELSGQIAELEAGAGQVSEVAQTEMNEIQVPSSGASAGPPWESGWRSSPPSSGGPGGAATDTMAALNTRSCRRYPRWNSSTIELAGTCSDVTLDTAW